MRYVCISNFSMPECCADCACSLSDVACVLDLRIVATLEGRPELCPLVFIDAKDVKPPMKKRSVK